MTFIYRCPNTGLQVQGWSSDEVPPADDQRYETVTCTACGRIHLVSPSTGRVVSSPH